MIAEYIEGDCMASVRDDHVVLVPPTSSVELTQRVWDILDNASSVLPDDVLAVLANEPTYALVSITPSGVLIAVRGTALADIIIDGEMTTFAPPIDRGAQQVFTGVQGVTLWPRRKSFDAPPLALPVGSGVVRTDAIHLEFGPFPDAAPVASVPVPAPEPAAAPAATPAPAPVPDEVIDTILPRPRFNTPPAAPKADLGHLAGDLPAAAPHVEPDPLGPLDQLAAIFSTGVSIELDRPILVGRAPIVSRVDRTCLPRLVVLPSPTEQIALTHAEITVVDGLVCVTDLGNGGSVRILTPGEVAKTLEPLAVTPLMRGSVVDFGDGASMSPGVVSSWQQAHVV